MNERLFELAQQLEERAREEGLARIQRANVPNGTARMSCIDCEDDIPAERRAAVVNVQRCIACEIRVEKANKWGKK